MSGRQPNDRFAVNVPEYYEPYGMRASVDGPLEDAAPLQVTVTSGDTEFTIMAHYWTAEGYASALRRAGFTDLRWYPPEVAPEGIAALGPAFWTSYLARPWAMLLDCAKPALPPQG